MAKSAYIPCLLFCLILAGCGSSTSVKTVPPTADFSLTSTPATVTLTAGAAGQQVSVEAVAMNGFTGTVSVAISGLPTGVTASPATLTLTPGVAQSVTLTAASTAVAGSATLTLTGTSGTLSHSATVAATIAAAAPAEDFSLTVAPATVALTAGAAGQQVSVEAVAVNGFTGAVSVAISGLPTGVTASPATLTLTPGAAQTVTLAAASTAAAGSAMVTLTGTSGPLSHTATVTTTVSLPPAADFSLTSTPAAVTLTAGAAGQQVSLLATAVNSFTGSVAIAISGLPNGVTADPATLTLTPGSAQNVTLTASSGAAAATATVVFSGTSGTLSHTATVAVTVAAATSSIPDITTYHDDVARDGLNAQEKILTPSNVNSTQFGKIGFYTADGLVDAEPLYLANVTAGGKQRNVLYVATENDSVYAFDADTGTRIWKTPVLGSGETTSDDRGCGQITPQIGITSTPAIDRSQGPNGTIFVVGMTEDASGGYHQRLHALDVTTGAEISGSPTEISASYPGTGANSSGGNVIFDPGQYAERAALLLLNGNIYLTWTSHCDQAPYTGWVMAYSESTLKQTQILNVTPNGSEGSIWMSGDGPAADSDGNIYLLDANGTFDTTLTNGFPINGDYGNAMLKLSTSGGKLAVADYFETYDTVKESENDADLGSGGEILLPPQTDMNGNTYQLVVGAGKQDSSTKLTNIYVANISDMGRFTANDSANSYIYQVVPGAISGGVFSTPAYFNGTIYYGARGDNLKAFPITNAVLATEAASQSAVTFSSPGTTPSISANGTTNGIVWALESNTGAPAVLHAYDATNLANELYNSGQAANSRDSFGNGNKFITPMIVNGKVYVGTPTGVAVFGLLPQ